MKNTRLTKFIDELIEKKYKDALDEADAWREFVELVDDIYNTSFHKIYKIDNELSKVPWKEIDQILLDNTEYKTIHYSYKEGYSSVLDNILGMYHLKIDYKDFEELLKTTLL